MIERVWKLKTACTKFCHSIPIITRKFNPLGHLSFFKKEYFKDLNKRHLSESLTSVQILL